MNKQTVILFAANARIGKYLSGRLRIALNKELFTDVGIVTMSEQSPDYLDDMATRSGNIFCVEGIACGAKNVAIAAAKAPVFIPVIVRTDSEGYFNILCNEARRAGVNMNSFNAVVSVVSRPADGKSYVDAWCREVALALAGLRS